MLLVVGLGNPGSKYERNRHNIGFLAVDKIAGDLGAGAWNKKFQGLLCEAKNPDNKVQKIYFLKPQTYMNLSGESVAAAANFYKIVPENIIVIYDEIDLLPGKLRVKKGGGNGGHNGIKSIDAHLGKEYWRMRIGVGRPEDKNMVADYVLNNFSKSELIIQNEMLNAISEYFSILMEGDESLFMNRIAQKLKA